MGNKSKHKTKRILVATATLTILASGMASSPDVFAEEMQQPKNYQHHCKVRIQLNQKIERIQSQGKVMSRY